MRESEKERKKETIHKPRRQKNLYKNIWSTKL